MVTKIKTIVSDQINKLKNIAKFGETTWREFPTAAVKVFLLGEETVAFLSTGVLKEFRTITTALYSLNKAVQKNYTLENFINELVDLLRRLNKEEREASSIDWNVLIKSLVEKPDIEAEVVFPIYGVLLETPLIQLGDFKIYSREALIDEHPDIKNIINIASANSQILSSEYFLAQNVVTKSIEKCKEEAERNFFIFENVSNFVTAGFHRTYKVSLFNSWFYSQVEHMIFAGNQTLFGGKTLHRFEPVKIGASYFSDNTNGYEEVWKLITTKRNDLQNKILESIEWSGKASVETDDNKAFLLYIIAIESILNYTHNSSLYSPITISLADSVAFLLGKNKKSRKEYAKHVIDLYGIRSGIVHGSIRQISDLDLHRAFSLSHQIIKKILLDSPYKSFTSKQMLSEYLLKEKKYEMGEP